MATPNFFQGFLALGTGSTSFVELVGTGYTRFAATFGPIVGGTTFSLTAATFAAGSAWPTITQFGLYGPSGNLDLWWNRNVLVTLGSGQTLTVPAGSLPLVIPSLMSASPASLLSWAPLSPIGTAEGTATLMTGPYGGQFGGSL